MNKTDCVYIYDGSYDGFLCCIFEAFELKEEPIDITPYHDTLLLTRNIVSDDKKAARVKRWLLSELGQEFATVVRDAYLSREDGAELTALRLTRLGHVKGRSALKDLTDPTVVKALKLSQSVGKERHRIIEFLRFTDVNGNLVSVINPKHFVLPLISSHFENRFPNENYFIYDEIHHAALVHCYGKSAVVPVEEFTLPPPTVEEEKFRKLWKLFYETIEIKQRRNHDLRRQHLPKRFWKNVTELCDVD